MAQQQQVIYDDAGNPLTPSDVGMVFDDEGKPVMAASHEAPKESTFTERLQQLPGELPRLLKEAAWKAAGPGLFADTAGAGATAGGMAGLALAGETAGASLLIPILTALGAAGGKAVDLASEGKSFYPSDVAPRVAGETLLSMVPAGFKGGGNVVAKAGERMARSAIKPTVSAGAGEAQRRFGSRALASDASDEIIRRGLERNMFGGADPIGTVKAAQEATVEELNRVIGDQPVTLAPVLSSPFRRARGAASGAVKNIPGAQSAVRSEINALRKGVLGEDVTRPVVSHVPSPILGPSGQPLMTMRTTPVVARRFREEVPAKELWDAAKKLDASNNYERPATDLIDKFNQWTSGAMRGGVKGAVPEAQPVLARYGDETALLKMMANPTNRETNKNQVMRLPTMLAALADLSQGRLPIGAVVANVADRTALQNSQRLFNAGRDAPRTAAKAMLASDALREALMRLLSEEPQP
jgi:hypothetical protein